ncbi:MAG: phosphotransferase [Anaerolineae bacterium]|jgi:uncharacterized protein (TIGR02172 family)
MSKGAIIGEGRMAEVFAWEEGQVLKLFRAWCHPERVRHEAHIARTVQATGLAVPAVGDVVQVDGRWGIVYERVEGRSMLDCLTYKPWDLVRFARTLAELHAAMHARTTPQLPSLRRRLENKIQNAEPLPADLKAAALQALARLPDGNALCHGDFHPHNVLMSPQGPIVIDWPDATRGHPLADVARTCLLTRTGGLPASVPRRWLVLAVRAMFRAAYLRRYFQLRPGSRELLAAWQLPVAAGRLEEGIVEEEEQLVALVKASLQG